MLAGGVLAKIQLPTKKDGPFKKIQFLGKDWICMKNLTIQFAQARDQITNIYQREILHSRDVQIIPREKDQVDFV